MDTELLNEICKRVQEKLKEAQAKANTTEEEKGSSSVPSGADGRPWNHLS